MWSVWFLFAALALLVAGVPRECAPLHRLTRRVLHEPTARDWACVRAHLSAQQSARIATGTGDRLLRDLGEAQPPAAAHLQHLMRQYDHELERLMLRHVEQSDALQQPSVATAPLVARYHLTQTLKHSPYLLAGERAPQSDDAARQAWVQELTMRRFLREPGNASPVALTRLRVLCTDATECRTALRRYETQPTPEKLAALKQVWTLHELAHSGAQ